MATLATDRALLLLGVPGTAKTWVSEHLAAAVVRRLDAARPGHRGHRRGGHQVRLELRPAARRGTVSRDALVPSPVLRAMAEGRIARVEELTRIPSDVQDALITILSEKTLPVPELGTGGAGAQGASTSSPPPTTGTAASTTSPQRCAARFNTVVLPVPAIGRGGGRHRGPPGRRARPVARAARACRTALEEIRRVVTVFRELRGGVTADGRTKVKSPTGTLSTAEAISVVTSGLALAAHFGDGVLRPADVAAGIARRGRCRTRSPTAVVWREYLETVVRGPGRLEATSTAPAASAGTG